MGDALETAGKEYSVSEVVEAIEKDNLFYEVSDGGVTLSGGESMIQDIDYLENLCKKLKRRGIHIAVDTSGYAPTEHFKRILKYVDIFLYDIKTMDDEVHKKFVGKGNKLILENLIFLNEHNASINIRIPIIKGVNATTKDMEDIIDFLKHNNIHVEQINLLPYHEIGTHKYERLNLGYSYDSFGVPSNEIMKQFQELYKKSGYNNTLIGG